MLRLDQDSDQNVSVNWRRVASTFSFQVDPPVILQKLEHTRVLKEQTES